MKKRSRRQRGFDSIPSKTGMQKAAFKIIVWLHALTITVFLRILFLSWSDIPRYYLKLDWGCLMEAFKINRLTFVWPLQFKTVHINTNPSHSSSFLDTLNITAVLTRSKWNWKLRVCAAWLKTVLPQGAWSCKRRTLQGKRMPGGCKGVQL